MEMHVFSFASRIFAYKRLAQGLSRSLSAFLSFMREYLDRVVKADPCSQYVDNNGIAAKNATELTNRSQQIQVPQFQKGLTALTGIRKLLQKLTPQDGRKT